MRKTYVEYEVFGKVRVFLIIQKSVLFLQLWTSYKNIFLVLYYNLNYYKYPYDIGRFVISVTIRKSLSGGNGFWHLKKKRSHGLQFF